jgi:hypothetical protein
VIVLITGCFHIYRGAPFDGVVFLATGAGLALAETRSPAPIVAGRGERLERTTTIIAVVLLALVLTAAPRYGGIDVVVVGVLGVAGLVVAATRGDVEPPARLGAAWPYAVAGLIAALNELTSYFLQTSPVNDRAHPAFSDLMDPIFNVPVGRAVFVLVWLGAGWGLLHLMPARATRSEPRTAEDAP